MFKMTTEFGKRRGWEIQRMSFGKGQPYYRMTERDGGCREATERELAIWRFAKLPFGKDIPVQPAKRRKSRR
jgi:hypothetical protein